MTGFTTKVADTALSEATELLADLVANPRFEQEDLEREQKVILEEMKMVEDTPDELLGELFNAAYFPNQPRNGSHLRSQNYRRVSCARVFVQQPRRSRSRKRRP
jgi:predicted Zn-dependent peptidase